MKARENKIQILKYILKSLYANANRESKDKPGLYPSFSFSDITNWEGGVNFVKTNFLLLIEILFERFTEQKGFE